MRYQPGLEAQIRFGGFLGADVPEHHFVRGPALPPRLDGERFYLTRDTVKGHDHHFQRRAEIPVMLPRSDLGAHRGARIRVDGIGDLATDELVGRLCSHLAHQRLVDVDVAAVGMNTHGDRAVIEQPAVLLIGLNVLGLLSKSERLYALDTFQGDSCHRVLPTWLTSTFQASARRARVSTPLSSPLETEYSSAFSEFRLIYRFTSPQWTKSHVAFGLTMTETGGDG